jgi:hypothetical protein
MELRGGEKGNENDRESRILRNITFVQVKDIIGGGGKGKREKGVELLNFVKTVALNSLSGNPHYSISLWSVTERLM